MKKVVIEDKETVNIHDVHSGPVFAVNKDEEIIGMIIHENNGYITRKHNNSGSSGHHPTLHACIRADSAYWNFVVN